MPSALAASVQDIRSPSRAACRLAATCCARSRPLASSVNWSGADQNRAAFNGSALGAGRGVDNYAFSATDVIVDLAGWFT